MKEVKIGMRRMIVKLLEERREWIGEVSKLKYLGCVLNDEVQTAVRRKEAAWKEVLAASDEKAKERCREVYREEKGKIKWCKYQSKEKVNEQSERKMNENVNGNRK